MSSLAKFFRWRDHGQNICETPVQPLEESRLDGEHPARKFSPLWDSLPKIDGIPQRSSFNPAQTPFILPWIMLFDMQCEHGECDFLLRLQGTKAVTLTLQDYTGLKLSEFTQKECYESRRSGFHLALEQKQPVFGLMPMKPVDTMPLDVTMGVFPFHHSGGDTQLFVIVAPDDPRMRKLIG